MQPYLRRVDHLICFVPDIERAHRRLTRDLGYPEAWPIGPFWPQGRTSGVAFGGINLELMQPNSDPPAWATISTVVFEPADGAEEAMTALGLEPRPFEKWEADPELVRLRFGDPRAPRLICRNLLPSRHVPFDFFLCDYSPELRDRLAPDRFPDTPKALEIVAGTTDVSRTTELWPIEGGVPVRIVPNDRDEVLEIRTERGPVDLGDWPAAFRLV